MPPGDLCLSLMLARSRATEDAFILTGVDLPLRKMTSNESFFGEGGHFLCLCVSIIALFA